jgi:hypothetical protein
MVKFQHLIDPRGEKTFFSLRGLSEKNWDVFTFYIFTYFRFVITSCELLRAYTLNMGCLENPARVSLTFVEGGRLFVSSALQDALLSPQKGSSRPSILCRVARYSAGIYGFMLTYLRQKHL